MKLRFKFLRRFVDAVLISEPTQVNWQHKHVSTWSTWQPLKTWIKRVSRTGELTPNAKDNTRETEISFSFWSVIDERNLCSEVPSCLSPSRERRESLSRRVQGEKKAQKKPLCIHLVFNWQIDWRDCMFALMNGKRLQGLYWTSTELFQRKTKTITCNRKGVACIFRGGCNEEKITWAPKGASRLGEGGNLFQGLENPISHDFPRTVSLRILVSYALSMSTFGIIDNGFKISL